MAKWTLRRKRLSAWVQQLRRRRNGAGPDPEPGAWQSFELTVGDVMGYPGFAAPDNPFAAPPSGGISRQSNPDFPLVVCYDGNADQPGLSVWYFAGDCTEFLNAHRMRIDGYLMYNLGEAIYQEANGGFTTRQVATEAGALLTPGDTYSCEFEPI